MKTHSLAQAISQGLRQLIFKNKLQDTQLKCKSLFEFSVVLIEIEYIKNGWIPTHSSKNKLGKSTYY